MSAAAVAVRVDEPRNDPAGDAFDVAQAPLIFGLRADPLINPSAMMIMAECSTPPCDDDVVGQ